LKKVTGNRKSKNAAIAKEKQRLIANEIERWVAGGQPMPPFERKFAKEASGDKNFLTEGFLRTTGGKKKR